MRIYTEVIFKWDDKQSKLVETSSKSFDYSGELALCATWDNDRIVYYDRNGDKWSADYKIHNFNEIKAVKINKNDNRYYTYSWKNEKDATEAKKIVDEYLIPGRALATDKAGGGFSAGTLFTNEEDYRTWVTSGGEGSDDFGGTDTGQIKTIALGAIKGLVDEWKRIVGGDSEYSRAVSASLENLKMAGREGGAYTDPITGEEVSVEGALTMAEADYETSVARAGEDLATAEEAAGTGREAALGAARAGVTPAIREAEAAAAATGFAGTGAGDEAREALAEEFLGGVEDIEAGFDVDVAAAATAEGRAIEGAETAFGGAQANFSQIQSTHLNTVKAQEANAQNALRGLQTDMGSIIAQARTDLNEDWSPFDGTTISDSDILVGWDDPLFDPSAAERFKMSRDVTFGTPGAGGGGGGGGEPNPLLIKGLG